MAETLRISIAPTKFNIYINSTDDNAQSTTIPTVQTRFGWTDLEVAAWHTKRLYWRDTLYPKYGDKTKSTPAIKKEVKKFIKDFRTTNNPLLDRAAASTGSTSDDEVLYNFKKGRAPAHHQTEKMTAQVYALIKAIGGGEVVFRSRTETDAKRSRIPKELGADSVQIAYVIGIVPKDENDGTQKEVHTKAKFTLSCGTSSSPRKLYIFVRWYNTKNSKIAGPWSAMITIDLF